MDNLKGSPLLSSASKISEGRMDEAGLSVPESAYDDSSSSGMAVDEVRHPLMVKWTSREIAVTSLGRGATILQLKEVLYEHTKVLPHRQKLMGGGRSFTDDLAVGDVFKVNQKIMMMGSPEETIASVIQSPSETSAVSSDLEAGDDSEIPPSARQEYLAKIERRVLSYEMELVDGFREGKKLLVLDIDYTIFDNGSVGQSGADLMRPFLHECLHVAYKKYDIVIWSATSKRWINAKLQELGIRANAGLGNYKIAAVLDDAAMISVQSAKGPLNVKPLGVIWGKYPQFSAKNTLIVDDMRRNFLMNPHSGLRISQYRRAFENRNKDKELVKLAEYLEAISTIEDFTTLNHRKWEKLAQEHRRKLRRNERAQRSRQSPGTSQNSEHPPS